MNDEDSASSWLGPLFVGLLIAAAVVAFPLAVWEFFVEILK